MAENPKLKLKFLGVQELGDSNFELLLPEDYTIFVGRTGNNAKRALICNFVNPDENAGAFVKILENESVAFVLPSYRRNLNRTHSIPVFIRKGIRSGE